MDYQGYDRDFNLTNKVALITGGAAGIGKATATLYAVKGASLILADRSPGLHEVVKEIFPDPATIEAVIGDITIGGDRERIVRRLYHSVAQTFGAKVSGTKGVAGPTFT